MRTRSWMTAWTLFAGLGCATFSASAARAEGGDEKPVAIENTVKLEIQITGLGAQGANVEIKPAHPGCAFKAVKTTIAKGARRDVVKLEPISVAASTTSADRDCSFEIILTEPGSSPKTFRRGLQLTPARAGAPTSPSRTLKCYLPATVVATRDDPKTKPRR